MSYGQLDVLTYVCVCMCIYLDLWVCVRVCSFLRVCVGLYFFMYVHTFEPVSLNGSLSAHFMFFCMYWSLARACT